MSQHDGVIDNAAGATVRADINNLAAALLTRSSGASAPSTTYANMVWVDTTNHLVKERNEANTAWIIRGRTDAEGLVTKSAGFTVGLRDYGKTFYCTTALTVAFTAAATLADGFWCRIINASTGLVTLDPDSSEQINGATTLDLRPGEGAYVETNGTLFRAMQAGPGLVSRQVFGLASAISPAQLTANTDNWAPTGIETCNVIRFSTDASRNITGITQGWDGRVLVLENTGSNDAVLKHDVTSTAANRFYCPNGADFTLKANSAAALRYDGTSSRWRVMASNASSSKVLRVYQVAKTDTFSTANTTPTDVTGLSKAVTPLSTNSKFAVVADVKLAHSTSTGAMFAKVVRDSTDLTIGDAASTRVRALSGGKGMDNSNVVLQKGGTAFDAPATVSSITFKVQIWTTSGTIYVNRDGTYTDATNFGTYASSLLIIEYED